MTLEHMPQIPLRTVQGFPLTTYQHDFEDHDAFRVSINAIIDYLNSLPIVVGGSVQTGMAIIWTSAALPSGYLWGNGAAVSRITYAALNALYAADGYPYGNGNGSTTFNLPDFRAKAPMGTNPMGGLTNGSFSTRTLGTAYGAENTSYTPAGSVSQASIASLTVTVAQANVSGLSATLGAIDISGVTVTVSQASVASITATLGAISLAGVTATLASIDISGLTSIVTLDNNAITGSGVVNISNVTCVPVNDAEASKSVIECAVLSVDVPAIAALLGSHVAVNTATIGGSIPSPVITIGGSISSPVVTIGGNIPVQNATVGGSIPSPIINLTGTIPVQSATVGGSIPVQTFTGTPANIPTVSPSLAVGFIIKT